MKRNYNYLLKPSSEQARTIDEWSESARLLYNFSLSDRRDSFKSGKSINYYDQARGLKNKKVDFPRYKNVQSQVLQQTLLQLDNAFKRFFKKQSKYPRFKARDSVPSLCFPQLTKVVDDFVIFPKLGKVKVKLHRPIPNDATIKQSRIIKEVDKYYVVLSLEFPEPTWSVPPVNVIGCDVGVKHLATLHDGTVIDGEQPLKRGLARLAKVQKRFAKKKTGSNNRRKQKVRVQKIHRKISTRRKDFLHKISFKLAETYDAIVFEQMNLEFINRNTDRRYMVSRKSYDIGIGTFRMFCEYKFAERGKQVFHVDPKNTTKECSRCHRLVPKELSDRVHLCPFCGLKMDRDLNAAINIRNRVGQGLPNVKPVESEASALAYAKVSFAR